METQLEDLQKDADNGARTSVRLPDGLQPVDEKSEDDQILEDWAQRDYEWGFTSDVDADTFEIVARDRLVSFLTTPPAPS